MAQGQFCQAGVLKNCWRTKGRRNRPQDGGLHSMVPPGRLLWIRTYSANAMVDIRFLTVMYIAQTKLKNPLWRREALSLAIWHDHTQSPSTSIPNRSVSCNRHTWFSIRLTKATRITVNIGLRPTPLSIVKCSNYIYGMMTSQNCKMKAKSKLIGQRWS